MKRAFAEITLTLTLALSAFAQTKPAPSAPTYEQTRKWAVDKISTEAGYNIAGGYNSTYEQVSMDECVLRFTNVTFEQGLATHEQGLGIPNRTTVSALIIPLNKVTSVKLSEHPDAKYGDNVFMDITTTGKAIKETFTVKDEKEKVASQQSVTEDLGRIIFGKSPTTDKELAGRMQKALNHAIDLCTKTPPKEAF